MAFIISLSSIKQAYLQSNNNTDITSLRLGTDIQYPALMKEGLLWFFSLVIDHVISRVDTQDIILNERLYQDLWGDIF